MAKRYDGRHGRGGHRRDRDHADDRGYMERAGDEVRSWFGDDDAERRRRMDEQRDYERERRHEAERYRGGSRGWSQGEGRSDWDRSEGARWAERDRDRPDWDRSRWHHAGVGRSDWDRTGRSRDHRDLHDAAGRDWSRSRETDWARQQHGPEDWRGSGGADSRYEDWGRTWAASDWDRDRADWDRGRSMHDRDWSDRGAMNRFGGSIWSADDGRMQFGSGEATGFGTTRVATRWGRGPKGYRRSDTRIHEDVCDRLAYSNVDADDIEVTVSNGEVTLAGTVRDRWDKHQAEDLAEAVAGVRDVHNQIRVRRPDRSVAGDETSRMDQTRGDIGASGTSSTDQMRRGIGQSETSSTDQPGSILGTTPTDRSRS